MTHIYIYTNVTFSIKRQIQKRKKRKRNNKKLHKMIINYSAKQQKIHMGAICLTLISLIANSHNNSKILVKTKVTTGQFTQQLHQHNSKTQKYLLQIPLQLK